MGTTEHGREQSDARHLQKQEDMTKKKKKKKERNADDSHQEDALLLHSPELQAEDHHARQDESSARSQYEGKNTHAKHSTMNEADDEDHHLQKEILNSENGKEEKTKPKSKGRRETIAEGRDLDGGTVMVEETSVKEKRKKKKEKNSEQLEEGSKDITKEVEQDQFEEKPVKRERKKEKRPKVKEVEDQSGHHPHLKEEEKEGHHPHLKEEEKERQHLQREEEEHADLLLKQTVVLTSAANSLESGGLVPGNTNRDPGDPVAGGTENKKKKEKKRKRVTFDNHIVAANHEQGRVVLSDAAIVSREGSKDDVKEIWGVRFSPEEDAILTDAVWKYIKSKGWDEHAGLQKVFNSKKHKDARNCWAEIKLSLPHRPRQAVRFRARLLLEAGAHLGKWSKEEEELLIRLQKEKGHKWREISGILNRHRASIKEKWRSLKRGGRLKEKGGWTQEELQLLSDMVHKSLKLNRLQAAKKKNPDRHILRDDIGWEQIANTLGTHHHGPCCSKWYYNLQSSLVLDGQWANQDDFFLLRSLLESGASAEEEVEWDNLLEHRSGQICLTRWKQMVKHLGENRSRQFLEKLDILARRYAPELLETSLEDNSIREVPVVTGQASLEYIS